MLCGRSAGESDGRSGGVGSGLDQPAGQDADDIGTVRYYSFNDASELTEFANINCKIFFVYNISYANATVVFCTATVWDARDAWDGNAKHANKYVTNIRLGPTEDGQPNC